MDKRIRDEYFKNPPHEDGSCDHCGTEDPENVFPIVFRRFDGIAELETRKVRICAVCTVDFLRWL